MIIHFIRHGETDYKSIKDRVIGIAAEYGINQTGRDQALSKKQALEATGTTFERIVSSPLSRTLETASILFPGQEITVEQAISAKSAGDWEWQLKALVYTQEYLDNSFDFIPPNGESYQMVLDRTLAWLLNFEKTHPNISTLAVVTHDFVLKSLLIHYLQIPKLVIKKLKIANLGSLVMDIRGGELHSFKHWG